MSKHFHAIVEIISHTVGADSISALPDSISAPTDSISTNNTESNFAHDMHHNSWQIVNPKQGQILNLPLRWRTENSGQKWNPGQIRNLGRILNAGRIWNPPLRINCGYAA